MKIGSAGTVVSVDGENHSLSVRFRAEGLINLPGTYLDAGWLDHGYARTTYGVQGTTLDRGLYHAGDRSSFEEGYVALTRARLETRIYLVDGTATVSEDDGHRGHASEPTGLDTVAMERRRAETPAIEVDAYSEAAAARYGHLDLAQLRTERERLRAVLVSGPPDVSESLREARVRRDDLQARRRTWATKAPEHVHVGQELVSIDRQLEGVDRRLDRLQERQVARDLFVGDRASEVSDLRLVQEAELARVVRVRLEAFSRPTPVTLAVLGPKPSLPAHRQSWSNAIELAAVHRERWGTWVPLPGEDDDVGVVQLLGGRPVDPLARHSYENVARAVHHAVATGPERAPDPGVEVAG